MTETRTGAGTRTSALLAIAIAEVAYSILLPVNDAIAEVHIFRDGTTITSSFQSITAAINNSRPGDVIEVGAGTYQESIRLMERHDLEIRGVLGETAIVIPSRVVRSWKPQKDLGEGLFAAPYRGGQPFYATASVSGEPTRLFIYNGSCRESMGHPSACSGRNFDGEESTIKREIVALELLLFGPGIYFDSSMNRLLLKLGNAVPPTADGVRVGAMNARALYVDKGSSAITVSNLTLKHGGKGTVWIKDAKDIEIRDSIILGGLYGVWIDRPASDIRLIGNEVRDLLPKSSRWEDFKSSVAMDGSAIRAPRAGRDNIIAENWIHGWFNGIGVGYSNFSSDPSMDPNPSDNSNIRIKNNLIEDILDDGIELEGFIRSGHVHGNLIRRVLVGIALAARYGDGDLFIYRNRIFANAVVPKRHYSARDSDRKQREHMRPLATKLGIGLDLSSRSAPRKVRPTENVHFHHNTFISTGLALAGGFANRVRADILPIRISWLDNIFVTRDQPTISRTGSADKGVRLDGNLYWQVNPATNRHGDCKSMTVLGWNQESSSRSRLTKHCGLVSARKKYPEWERHGAEIDPGLTSIDFTNPIDTPKPDSPAVDPSFVATPSSWPDESVLRNASTDRGAIELTDEIELSSVSPKVVSRGRTRFIVIHGRGFDARTNVTLGGYPLDSQELISTTTIFGRTPPGLIDPGCYNLIAIKGNQRSKRVVSVRIATNDSKRTISRIDTGSSSTDCPVESRKTVDSDSAGHAPDK